MLNKPKGSFLGAAGQIYVMSELLARGWNVAIPVVDVGDDVLVVDDHEKKLIRIQVKTGLVTSLEDEVQKVTFNLYLSQLVEEYESKLIFAFALRKPDGWQGILWINREGLGKIRRSFEERYPFRRGTGISDRMALTLKMYPDGRISGWRSDFGSQLKDIDEIFPHLP